MIKNIGELNAAIDRASNDLETAMRAVETGDDRLKNIDVDILQEAVIQLEQIRIALDSRGE